MKKTSRQNSNSTVNNLLLGQLTPKTEVDDAVTVSFQSEISDIMRGFGDGEKPIKESVELVEKILQQQLRGILYEAADVALKRKGVPAPSQMDFEFLMRKHPVKINRLKKHIKDKKLLKKILDMQAGRTQSLDESTGGNQDSDQECDTEIVERFDEEKTRRLFRADRISQILSGTQYQEFNNARRTSFYWRNSESMKHKLKSFLNIPPDITASSACLTILAYMAHETIATLVDFAILTRLNSENRVTEPYSRVTSSGASYGMLHICPEVTQGRGSDGIKPITVNEIQEGIRRYALFSRRGLGFHRNRIDLRNTFLAI